MPAVISLRFVIGTQFYQEGVKIKLWVAIDGLVKNQNHP